MESHNFQLAEEAEHSHAHEGETHPHAGESSEGIERSHSHTQTKAVLNRLSRAIGHLSAVRTMVEDGRDCSEVLIQLSAVRSAINSVSQVILKDHMENCVVDAAKTGDLKALDELKRAVELIFK
jgi:DNA-binding FrmR family transcriptional regulator